MDNSNWVIVDAVIYFSLALLPYLKLKRSAGSISVSNVSDSTMLAYLFGILLYCVVDRTDGDYFHLKEELSYLAIHPENYSGIEPFYRFIGIHTIFSYSLFRTIIWGSALIIYYNCIKLCRTLNFKSFWIFVMIALPYFSYPRVSLAICAYLLGFILVFNCRKTLIGLIFILLSYWLHKSIFILVLLTPICFIRMTGIRIILVIGGSMLLSIVATPIISILIENLGSSHANTILRYISSTQSMGIAEVIQTSLFWFPSILFLIKIINKKKFLNSNNFYNKLLSLIIIILSVSIFIQFSGIGSKFIYTRIREFSILPLCILISCYNRVSGFNNFTKICLSLYLLSDFYYMCYRYYLKVIGTGI